jgi:hypothetical protein
MLASAAVSWAVSPPVSRRRTAFDPSVVGHGGDAELVDGASDVAAVASIRLARSSSSADVPVRKRFPLS